MSARPGAPAPRDRLLLPARCKGRNPGLCFPRLGGSTEAAEQVCRGRPGRLPCLDRAIRAGEPAGVRGGATPDERTAIRRARKGQTP